MSSGSTPKSSSLPPLYNGWIEELLGGPTPEETRATCSDCAMLPRPDERPSELKVFFDPQSKCCTYLPDIPNFLVGRVFLDATPEMAAGRASMERRLAARVGISPMGFGQPSSYLLWYNHSKSGFGRSRTLRCPHYIEDGGKCSIWRHREGTCSTWFCKHDRGAASQRFWRDAVHRLLKAVEGALSRWCVLELDLGSAALERVLNLAEDYNTIEDGELEGKVPPADYRALWGRWLGREREFFEACSTRVEGLQWSEVAQICGSKVSLLARFTQDVYAELARTEPASALRCGSFRLVSLTPDNARLSTYNEYDPVDIPVPLLGLLRHFDGQPTSEVVASIKEREGVALDLALVRKLTDFALLVPVTESSASTATPSQGMGAERGAGSPPPKK